MVKANKVVRNHVTRFLSGQPLGEVTPGIPLTKDSLPKCLGGDLLRIARRGIPSEKRALLTLLYSTRAIDLGTTPNFGPIQAPNRSEKLADTLALLQPLIGSFWRSLGLRHNVSRRKVPQHQPRVEPRFSRFHQTTKSGPNGHALWTW